MELARNDKVHSGTERAEKISEKTSVTKKVAVVVAKKRERPSVLRLPSFAWYFISGSDKAPNSASRKMIVIRIVYSIVSSFKTLSQSGRPE